jgi:hypothetical protein
MVHQAVRIRVKCIEQNLKKGKINIRKCIFTNRAGGIQYFVPVEKRRCLYMFFPQEHKINLNISTVPRTG